MAMPSNKSSSLAAPPSRSISNARNSEISNPIRRSFSGNPFPKPSVITNPRSFNPNTPANSPSDFPRRNSVGGRESVGSFRDLDDKENGKDQNFKPTKVRSPAASKCAKNFMSPTISACSKITVSPRKKVLTEKNEPARTSFSSTDGKNPIRKVTFAETVEYSDCKLEVGLEEDKLQALSDDILKEEIQLHTASMISENLEGEAVLERNLLLNAKNETESSFETVSEEPDFVNLDPNFKLSPTPPPVSSTSTILAPLDADPLVPPYDPNMNYLSPRPQFLHYKPNARVELYKEREGMKLEDSFIFGSFSDTEVTEETQSESSQKESDVSSDEIVTEEQDHISEPSPTLTFMAEEIAEAKGVPKSGFFKRSKAIALLLLLSAACISIAVSNSPVIDSTAFNDQSIFSKVYESSEFSEFARANFDRFSELAKANFDGLARNFHIWFTKLMSSISELISTFRGVHKLGHLHYWNLTGLQEHIAVDQCPIFGHGEKRIGDTPQEYPSVLNVEENDGSTDIYIYEYGDILAQNYGSAYEEVQEADPPILNVEENAAATEIDTDEEDVGVISVGHYDLAYEEQVQEDMGVIAGVENASDAPEPEEVQENAGVITGVENASDAPEPEEVLEVQLASVIESEQALPQAEVGEPNHSESNIDYPDFSETAEIHTEVFEAGNLEAKIAFENDANVNEDPKDQADLNSEFAEIHAKEYDETGDVRLTRQYDEIGHTELTKAERKSISEEAVVLYLLLFSSLIAAGTAFYWFRKDESRSKRFTSSVEEPLLAKTLHVNSLSSPKEQAFLYKPCLRNEPIEMDVLGESCPSEMSSFQTSYSQKVVKEFNEAHSLEKNPKKNYRRESLASSDYSMGSPSYGSFTTYEKLPNKNGLGDEKTVTTPVRRSSRIRNQATSPL